jgi:sec-independent protein translocase protein TatA
MLAFLGSLGPWEIALIVIIALLLFGAKKLPEMGKAIGKGIREFKKGIHEIDHEISSDEIKPENDPYREINKNLENGQQNKKQ